MYDRAVVERAEITGRAIRAIIGAFGAFPILAAQYLANEGIGTLQPDGSNVVDPERYYPLRAWLNVLRRVERELPVRVLRQVGAHIMSAGNMPPGVTDLHSAFATLDAGYHAGHRLDGQPMFDPRTKVLRDGIGHLAVSFVAGQNLVFVKADTPVPCALNEGSVAGLARLFERDAEFFHEPGSCRAKGGESCTYRVTWPAG